MDIAALSISLNQSKLLHNVSIAMVDQAMELQQESTEQLLESFAPHPTSGQNIDISI